MESWRAVVGGNVRRLRRERGKTQEVLAQEAGIVVRYLSAIEAGRENPTVDVLGRLAAALETHPRSLWDQ
jgi:transcriptional regulator with XRE-family HTH domain